MHLHLIQNTYRADRHGRRPDAPKKPNRGLTDSQRELLTLMPKDLSPAERRVFVDQAMAAWWLGPMDRTALIAFASACVRHSAAHKHLTECLANTAFANPKSDVYKAGKLYSDIADKAAHEVLEWSSRLGFTPLSRSRLGIPDKPPEPPDPIWSQFRRPLQPDPS
jgi:phage terminase small subunit